MIHSLISGGATSIGVSPLLIVFFLHYSLETDRPNDQAGIKAPVSKIYMPNNA